MLRAAVTSLVILAAAGLPAKAAGPVAGTHAPLHLENLHEADSALAAARAVLPECEAGCITPGEAAAMAFSAGEGAARAGRFLLDIRGGGQSLRGELGQLLFVNSRQDYATFGTLTIAFEPEALRLLLQRARVCGAATVVAGQINVKGCRTRGIADLNMFTMMQRLGGRRIAVDGEVRMQWISSPVGSLRPVANRPGEQERGYYQVWVQVSHADQVIFIHDDEDD